MKAGSTIGVLLMLVATGAGAAEPDPGFASKPVGGSVSVLQGYERNIAVSAGDDGVVMVDTCGAEAGLEMGTSLISL